ncbi:MAG TPA: hypothetical protein VFD30_14710, partial [Terriglobia bacterium]|nr:hypothetical protein [Terriglobia bacterium]
RRWTHVQRAGDIFDEFSQARPEAGGKTPHPRRWLSPSQHGEITEWRGRVEGVLKSYSRGCRTDFMRSRH